MQDSLQIAAMASTSHTRRIIMHCHHCAALLSNMPHHHPLPSLQRCYHSCGSSNNSINNSWNKIHGHHCATTNRELLFRPFKLPLTNIDSTIISSNHTAAAITAQASSPLDGRQIHSPSQIHLPSPPQPTILPWQFKLLSSLHWGAI